MRFTSSAILSASSLLLAVGSAADDSPEVLVPRAVMSYVACYSSSDGLSNQTSYTFQSTGWCQNRCLGTNAAVFGLTAGSDCLCGDELPPSSDQVPDSKCGRPCDGWPQAMCGGNGYYSIYKTGLVSDVSSVSASTTSGGGNGGGNGGGGDPSTATKTDSSGGGSTTATNAGVETTIVTHVGSSQTSAGISSSSSSSSDTQAAAATKSSHNTAAIAAGVVVGVVGAAAIAGGVFFFYRSKKQKSDPGFRGTAGGYTRDSEPPAMSDTRFDGGYMAQRRQSNGSIDDDHDFSRRILQVTNPDR